ncbi:hypothetical protein WA026_018247 [Henosepilachna vigintioctopunctata]|uniref:Nuclear cap-binding protein subunit 2 n=1 Tax=Henosepilachna vigintioctopunctata TaxID=420089 RepID=A0AAW1V8L5_9CUCU
MSTSSSTSIEKTSYRDQRFKGTLAEQEKLLEVSTTLYVGNLSFYTTENQIYDLFARCGDIKRIIMGLDKFKRTPCGFCFVEYYTREDAENCMRCVMNVEQIMTLIGVVIESEIKKNSR